MKGKKNTAVFVALSGGVDSSVAALLLKKRGYDVTGIFMRCFNIDGCAVQDAEDARRVAECLGVPFYVWDFEDEYKRRVVEYMVEGYRKGLTPNPDVMCNKEIKFGLFFNRARAMGATYVATGHYVRREGTMLFSARDAQKDQSYFLWTLGEEQICHTLFPVGDYVKSEVRDMAREAGLPTAEKKDSQGICFLGKVTLGDFLRNYIPDVRGVVLGTDGVKLGEHAGAHLYTIGQRHGIGAVKRQKGNAAHVPLYVSEKDIKTNTVVLAEGHDNPALLKKEVAIDHVNIINAASLAAIKGGRMRARVRYRQPVSCATLAFDAGQKTATLTFDEPQKFVASGQSAVFYSAKGELLGGGVIV